MSEPRPIPMHLASVAPDVGAELARYAPAAAPSSPSSRPSALQSILRTVTLTASDPVQEIMAASDNRVIAYVVVVDADVVLADNKSDAAAGRGAYVPCVTPAAGKPNLSAPYPVQDDRVIYAGPVAAITGTNTIRVSVNAVYKA